MCCNEYLKKRGKKTGSGIGYTIGLRAPISALPAIMSITGPRETHEYCDYNLWVPGKPQSNK